MSGLKQRIADTLCHPIVGRAVIGLYKTTVPSRGLRFDLGPDPEPKVAARLYWGLYESSEIRFVNRYLRPDLDVVELGGSIGVVSSFIGRKQQTGQRLIVVEAVQTLLPSIRNNVARNAPSAELHLVHGALDYGVPDGATVSMAVDRDNTRGAVGRTGHQMIDVPTIRLSAELERQGITDFALVCDVEGAEWGLVDSDPQALDRCRQLILELHSAPPPNSGTPAELLERLLELGPFVEIDRHGPVVCLERPD